MKIEYSTALPTADEFFTLFSTTGWNEDYNLSKIELFSCLQNSYYCVSAHYQNKLIGMGRMLSEGKAHAVIFDVIVSPEFRNQKIGSQIMKLLIDKCRQDQIRDVQLFCAKGKAEFYKKLGFQIRSSEAPGMEIKLRYK